MVTGRWIVSKMGVNISVKKCKVRLRDVVLRQGVGRGVLGKIVCY